MSERVIDVAECPTCPVCASDVFVDAVPIPEDGDACQLFSFRFAPSEVRAGEYKGALCVFEG